MLFIQLRLSYFVAQVVAQLVYSTCAHAPAEASELALADAPQELSPNIMRLHMCIDEPLMHWQQHSTGIGRILGNSDTCGKMSSDWWH